MSRVACPYCGKLCKSEYGLGMHIKQTRCRFAAEEMQRVEKGQAMKSLADGDDSSDDERLTTLKRKANENLIAILQEDQAARAKLRSGLQKEHEVFETDYVDMEDVGMEYDTNNDAFGQDTLESGQENDGFDPLADDTDEEALEDTDDEAEEEDVSDDDDDGPQVVETPEPSKKSNAQMKAYVRYAYQNFSNFDRTEVACIRIMYTLLKKRATLDTYDAVMDWHLRDRGVLNDRQTLGDTKWFISRKKLLKKLYKRYHMDKFKMKVHRIVLPHTNTKVGVPWHHARDCVRSLLTDPRWKDEDWLFFDDDPFAPTPEDLDYVADFNTGQAYLETYRKLITKPNQVLCGIPLYIDGAVTGQFDKLQVTALKMSLCILNRKARDKEYAWRSLGLVPNYTKETSRGKRIFVESGHVAAHEVYMDLTDEEDEEGGNAGKDDEHDKAADYHAILEVLLKSVRELIKEGMKVDLFYKGRLHKNTELVFFVPFVKCDGDEGDKLCLSYRSRGKDIKQLCRYCQCPNEDTDNPLAWYPFKTEPMLKNMYLANNTAGLKAMSQICAKNAFHGLRFGLHNKRGIHGACPWELLHAILLGIFKYARDCFFIQMGKTSVTAGKINALAQLLGTLLVRQSDRKKPRTKFAQGIGKGKLMAKEYTGVLLIMSAILRCKKGQDTLQGAYKKNFRHEWQRKDWLLLVETLLQWEAYLMSDQMQKAHLERLKKKNRFVMFLLKKIGNRTKGMGFKVMKFHAIIHLAYDIIMFGVPIVVDTGSNESHHKTTKVAAKLTQKDIQSFEKQTLNRLQDFHVLELAMQEIDGRPLWHYFFGFDHPEVVEVEKVTKTRGMIMEVFWDDEENEAAVTVKTRMKNKDGVKVDTQLVNFLWEIQQELQHLVPEMPICSEHTREGIMFRAHPNFRGKGPWRDWATINWEEGNFPAKIWCFLDLRAMPDGVEHQVTEEIMLGKNVYAVIESADVVEEEEPLSDIWTPLQLEVNSVDDDGELTERKFYVVDVETIVDPICVIPDVGSTPKHCYLQMKPRAEWANDFIAWVEMSHANDKMEMQEEEQEEESSEEEEEG